MEVATGCRDQDAARRVLAELERRAELVKAGVVTSDENAVANHQSAPLADHFKAYLDHLKAKEVHRTRVANARGRLDKIAAECSMSKLVPLVGYNFGALVAFERRSWNVRTNPQRVSG